MDVDALTMLLADRLAAIVRSRCRPTAQADHNMTAAP
jgi:hypothetical protein